MAFPLAALMAAASVAGPIMSFFGNKKKERKAYDAQQPELRRQSQQRATQGSFLRSIARAYGIDRAMPPGVPDQLGSVQEPAPFQSSSSWMDLVGGGLSSFGRSPIDPQLLAQLTGRGQGTRGVATPGARNSISTPNPWVPTNSANSPSSSPSWLGPDYSSPDDWLGG